MSLRVVLGEHVDPVSPSVLAKWAGPMASRFAMNGIKKLTRNRRVARAAAKKAAAAGVPVTAKSLRVWLARADTAQQLRQCTERSLEEAARQLRYVIPRREPGERQADALLVLQLVMEEYVRSAAPSEASLVTGDWGRQTTQEDGAKTREQVHELRENVLGRMDARTDFDAGLRTLSPWSAQEARRLRAAWPAVERAVGGLAGVEAARGAVIQQWADQEPTWLTEAPAEALGWLGQLAADYDARAASHLFFERCAARADTPVTSSWRVPRCKRDPARSKTCGTTSRRTMTPRRRC
ncbi:hypothetical protein ACFZBZ_16790 [Streptomyces sp. NPDC008196]|uniref:hypothetical protein n=1 Tax=Streptomyces sp. NPDC008196 TaxID=3364819 RepID=UPI0036E4CFDA